MQKFPNETDYEFKERLIVGLKEGTHDLTWKDIQSLVEDEHHVDTFVQRANGIYEAYLNKNYDTIENSLSDEVYKQRQLLKTEMSKKRHILDEENKFEYIKSIIIEEVNKLNKKSPLYNIHSQFEDLDFNVRPNLTSAVISLSDWHYGLKIKNYLNEYNSEIFDEKIDYLFDKVVDFIEEENVDTLYTLLLGDFISGNIHNVIRLSNTEDLISQLIHVSEAIAKLISNWSAFVNVKVALVSDNHARVTVDKKDNIESENYIRIIEWYVKSRLENNKSVEFIDSNYGLSMCDFKIFDFNCLANHGHDDNKNNIINNMSMMCKEKIDFLFSAHNHHFSIEENGTTVIFNGCLCGVDEYSLKLRKISKPCQVMTIIDENGLKKLIPIYC